MIEEIGKEREGKKSVWERETGVNKLPRTASSRKKHKDNNFWLPDLTEEKEKRMFKRKILNDVEWKYQYYNKNGKKSKYETNRGETFYWMFLAL